MEKIYKCAWSSVLFLLAFLPASNAQFSMIAPVANTFCTGQFVTYSVASPDPNYTYNWYVDEYSQYQNTGAANHYLAGSGTAFTTYTGTFGAVVWISVEKVDQTNTVVDQSSVVQANALGNGQFLNVYQTFYNCGALSVPDPIDEYRIITPNAYGMWYLNGVPTGNSNAHIDGPFPVSGNYQYKLKICNDTLVSSIISVIATPPPVIAASGPTTFCQGDSVRLTLTSPGFGVWNWLKNGGALSSSGTSILVKESGSYSVQAYTASGNGSQCFQISTPIVVTMNSGAVITAASTGCTGDSVQLSCTAASSYLWKKNGTAITGATTQSIFVKTTGNYTVETTGLVCNVSQPKTITFYPKATVAISPTGSVSLCNGTTTTLAITGNNIFKYEWLKGGVSMPGSNTSSLVVTKNGSYKCVVTNQVGCTKTSATVTISIPTPVALPIATLTLQPDTSGIDAYTTCAFGNNTYNYGNATTLEISNWYKYFRTAEHGILKFDLTKLPANAPIISANVQLWADTIAQSGTGSQTLFFKRFIQDWNEHSISWMNEPDSTDFQQASILTSAITSKNYFTASIVDLVKHWSFHPSENYGMLLVYDEMKSPYVWISAASSDNAIAAHRPKLTLQYNYAKIDSSGPLSFCTGGSVTFTTNTGFSYQWYKDNVAIAGATNAAYTATTAGAYYVVLSNTAGCSVTSAIRRVVINPLPTMHVTPPSPVSFCYNSTVTLVADSLLGYTFQWSKNGAAISGATARKYTVSNAGTYTVKVTNSCGMSDTLPIVCTKITNPVPTITAGGPITFCAGQNVLLTADTLALATYQWRLNNVDIAGATNQVYTAATAGNYYVRETLNGCTRGSAITTITINCRILSEENTSLVKIYPQPFSDRATIDVTGMEDAGTLHFEVYNIDGQLMQNIPSQGEMTQFESRGMKSGMYYLRTLKGEKLIAVSKVLLAE